MSTPNIVPHEVSNSDKSLKEKWRDKAYSCATGSEHNYIPVSWIINPKSRRVAQLLCLKCFHELNLEEASMYKN